jgi:protein ImuA
MTSLKPSSCADAPADLSCDLHRATLSARDIAAISKQREARWKPGLADQPFHSEIFASARDASGAGLALALARDALRVAARSDDPAAEAQDRRHVLWVQDAQAIKLGGRPYLHGLPRDLRERLIHVEAKSPEDALFALEEGLRCRDLACVIGEVFGNPRALDFTASRRLSLAAEKHGVALWLVRLESVPDLSSARMRWRVEPAASPCPRWNAEAPGTPTWKAELFRARRHAPGQWIVSDEDTLRARKPECAPQFQSKPQLGSALARKRRFWHPGGGGPTAVGEAATGPSTAADPRHLVRTTVGRSLAARARA